MVANRDHLFCPLLLLLSVKEEWNLGLFLLLVRRIDNSIHHIPNYIKSSIDIDYFNLLLGRHIAVIPTFMEFGGE